MTYHDSSEAGKLAKYVSLIAGIITIVTFLGWLFSNRPGDEFPKPVGPQTDESGWLHSFKQSVGELFEGKEYLQQEKYPYFIVNDLCNRVDWIETANYDYINHWVEGHGWYCWVLDEPRLNKSNLWDLYVLAAVAEPQKGPQGMEDFAPTYGVYVTCNILIKLGNLNQRGAYRPGDEITVWGMVSNIENLNCSDANKPYAIFSLAHVKIKDGFVDLIYNRKIQNYTEKDFRIWRLNLVDYLGH